MDVHFFRTLSLSVLVIVVVSSIVVSLVEGDKRSVGAVGDTVYWAVTTVIGSGDSSYVNSPGGFVIGWLLAFFGVAIVAALTAAVVGFVIDFLLKEGQGMGASGFRDHIVVCGWNSTARELVDELKGDEFPAKVVLLHTAEHNPAGAGVYYVRGDATSGDDLERAGTSEAASAIVFPLDATDEADMRSILVILAIESITPDVRTVVEVNNPKHVAHFKRAKANEILVTSRLASRLLARSALYPGMAGLVTDIVSGGEGSELYHVEVPGGVPRPHHRPALRGAARRPQRHAARRHPQRREHDQPGRRTSGWWPATTRSCWPRASVTWCRSRPRAA